MSVSARVRRSCPYCKDDIHAEPHVLCVRCLTAHHRSCFSENRGCTLLGCRETRSLCLDEACLDACPACGVETPSSAPFCSWCQAPLGGEPARRRGTRERLRFAGACAALLVSGGRAQDAFRAKDPEGQYAPSWAALAAVASPSTTLADGFEVRVCRSAEKPRERFCAIAVPTKTTYAYRAITKTGVWPRVSLDEKGVHTHAWSDTPLVLDEEHCRAIAAEPHWRAR